MKKGTVTIRKRPLVIMAVVYIYIPVIVFLIGFVKAIIALPITGVLSFVAYRFIRVIRSDKENEFHIHIGFLSAGILFLLVFGYFCGWGRWVWQTFDWNKHNAVLSDLVERDWPVYYRNGEEKSMLTYYVGQYLVPALFGKLIKFAGYERVIRQTVQEVTNRSAVADSFLNVEVNLSFRIAEIMQYVWTEIGLIIIWLNFLIYIDFEKLISRIVASVMLLFFSVPQSVVEILVYLIYGIDCLYNNNIRTPDDSIMLQYSGHFVYLSWVFTQTIVPWLILLIFLNYRDNIRFYLFYMVPMLLFAPFPLIGLVPLAAGHAICVLGRERKPLIWLKKVFSPENLLSLFSLGTVLCLYYLGNVTEPKPDRLSFHLTHYGKLFGIYLIFVLFNVVIYAVFLYHKNRKDDLYYIAFGELIFLPFFFMGYYNDLNMRSSIPAVFIVMCMVTKYLIEGFEEVKKKKELTSVILYAVMAVMVFNGVSYQVQRFNRKLKNEDYTVTTDLHTYGTLEYFANRSLAPLTDEERETLFNAEYPKERFYGEMTVDLIYNYYSYDLEDNLFYKYLARKRME